MQKHFANERKLSLKLKYTRFSKERVGVWDPFSKGEVVWVIVFRH